MYICLHPYTLTSKYPLHQHTLHLFLPPIILLHMPTSHIQFTHTFTLHIHTLPSPCTHHTRGEVTMSPSHIPLSTKTPLITSVLQLCLLHCSTFRTGQSLTTISQRIGQSHVLTTNQIHHSLCLILCIPMLQWCRCGTASSTPLPLSPHSLTSSPSLLHLLTALLSHPLTVPLPTTHLLVVLLVPGLSTSL